MYESINDPDYHSISVEVATEDCRTGVCITIHEADTAGVTFRHAAALDHLIEVLQAARSALADPVNCIRCNAPVERANSYLCNACDNYVTPSSNPIREGVR